MAVDFKSVKRELGDVVGARLKGLEIREFDEPDRTYGGKWMVAITLRAIEGDDERTYRRCGGSDNAAARDAVDDARMDLLGKVFEKWEQPVG